MDIEGIIDAMLAVAAAAAPLVGDGAPEAVELGTKVIEMIDQAVEAFGDDPDGMSALLAKRDEIEAATNQHVDDTIGRLERDA